MFCPTSLDVLSRVSHQYFFLWFARSSPSGLRFNRACKRKVFWYVSLLYFAWSSGPLFLRRQMALDFTSPQSSGPSPSISPDTQPLVKCLFSQGLYGVDVTAEMAGQGQNASCRLFWSLWNIYFVNSSLVKIVDAMNATSYLFPMSALPSIYIRCRPCKRHASLHASCPVLTGFQSI